MRLDLESPSFPEKAVWQIVAKTGKKCDGSEHDEANCGRPLGMAFLPDGDLVVCDAIHGLLRVDVATGKSTVLVVAGINQALFLSTISVVFRTLLHASTMSQTIPDIHSSSQIFPVSEGMSF